ncbi:hypothetical protein PYCCODRAFT_1085398 [Trametes coccinea BRFM310]|uniref:Uncharacterized protein n=1 Tax=Trametes coccinea (strain BRFM310) TaxID=1353009 RepID=A0A1Y2IYM6_TRAC3|nr:hypothetical protein PYCCODRAFT_1085398 [Trametes coccinea BRFM310]
MDRRGRSREVSPVAVAVPRTACRDAPGHAPFNHPQPHLSFFRHPSQTPPSAATPAFFHGPSKLTRYDPRDSISHFRHPVPSSSRLPPPPSPQPPLHNLSLSSSPSDTLSRTHSSSSVLSTSSEPNPPEPLTPPDVNADYAYACERPLEYYESPPSPPRTLQDQMHVAYALENMHLAKILLLKLRGIEVNGDDDPRIAQVRDEDFSSSFVPDGGLRLDEATEARVLEAERRAQQAQKRREREERLRRCERIWESSAQRLKTEKARIARQREEESRARRRAELEARERERERVRKEEAARAARQSQLRIASGPPRQLLSYDSLRNADARFPKPSPTRERSDDSSSLFLYDIMPSPPSRPASLSSRPCSVSPTDKNSLSLARAQKELALQHARSVSRSVPFSDVLTAMHGPLFPDDVQCRPHPRLNSQQAELLAILMEPVDASKVDAKGKGRDDSIPKRRVHVKPSPVARVVRSSTLDSISSTSSGTPSSASTVTRSGSWFSFGSRGSLRSTSTALTTPSSSPRTPTKSIILQSSAPLSSSPPRMESSRVPGRSLSRQPAAPSVPATDHPLALPPPPKARKAREPLAIGRGRPLTRHAGQSGHSDDDSPPRASGLVHRVSRSVSSIMDFAAQFQKAYVKATMFSAGVDLYTTRSRSRDSSSDSARSPSRSPVRSSRVRCASVPVRGRSGGLRPQGYRACSLDVQLFTAIDRSAEESAPHLQRTLIPLSTPTVDTIPAYERVFPLPPALPRSPYRPPCPPESCLSRLRPVANPLLVRLQALQNVCRVYGIPWQSRKQDILAGGLREKVVGVAWEGLGRSGLGWEVSAY